MDGSPEQIREGSESNRRFDECDQKINRISDLPEEILHQILTLLPTKQAVAATILSTKWKNLLQFPPNSNLDLQTRLRRYSDFQPEQRCSRNPIEEFLQTVSNLHACKTLTSLKLQGGGGGGDKFLFLFVPNGFSLPNLKELYFDSIDFDEEERNLERFLDGCPQLLKLSLCEINCESFAQTLSICSASIEYLKIDSCVEIEYCRILFDVPQLKTFVYEDDMAKNYVIKSPMNQLVEAHIDARFGDKYFGGSEDGSHHEHNYSEEDQASANLVAVCTNARTLYLSCDTIETIQHVYAPPRSFYQLTEVSLDRMNIDGWKFLACLLEYAPNLERLFMKGFSQFTNGFVQFKSSLLEVPTCLS